MALLANSRALDKGHSSGVAFDQRSYSRTIDLPGVPNASGGDGADIGAFEFIDLDVDGNNAYDPNADGLLILRYLFGFSGPSLVAGATGPLATRDLTQIGDYLLFLRPLLDVDGNGKLDPLTDGVMVVRYLDGLRGSALTNGAIGAGATRGDAQIEAHIKSLLH